LDKTFLDKMIDQRTPKPLNRIKNDPETNGSFGKV
jgi:hypothetical protein